MEARRQEVGARNHFQNIFSQAEIEKIPQEVVVKINNYINSILAECLVAQASIGATKAAIEEKLKSLEATVLEVRVKYEDTANKLLTAEETVTELENQYIVINSELELAQDTIMRLKNDATLFKSARDAAIDERNDLTRILQWRNTEIDRLIASKADLSQQLRAVIDAKCETLASNDDVLSKELVLENRVKDMENEINLLYSQIANLNEEVIRLTSKLQTDRLNNTNRIVNLKTQLKENLEKLSNETFSKFNDAKKALNDRIESLTQQLKKQKEVENKIIDHYNKELDAKNKLNDLLRAQCYNIESQRDELTDGIRELQKLLNESFEKYGVLEANYKQADVDHEKLIIQKNLIISHLKLELEHAKDLVKATQANNLDMVISEISPSAATASKLLKSGMSLTQLCSQSLNVTDELSQEKEENRKLNNTIKAIVQEIEGRAPIIHKQKVDYEEALERNIALSQQLELLASECDKLKEDYTESSRIADHYNRENTILKGDLEDLGKQVCFLLKELEHSSGGLIPNGGYDSSTTTNSSDGSSSQTITKNLVTFSDIQELQYNNQELLHIVRDLTEKEEELERLKEQIENGEIQTNVDFLKNRVSELSKAEDRHIKMINDLLKQKLYYNLMKATRYELSRDKGERSKQVLKQAKIRIVQLTEKNCSLSRELDEMHIKLGAMEQSTREELGALAQMVTVLQRQLASQASAAEQQVTTENTTADPPNANMKPLTGSACEASTQAAGSACASKRRLPARALASKRTRPQGSDRSLQVGHQVPTLSRYHQDEEGVIVIDSDDDDEPCTGAMYRDAEEGREAGSPVSRPHSQATP